VDSKDTGVDRSATATVTLWTSGSWRETSDVRLPPSGGAIWTGSDPYCWKCGDGFTSSQEDAGTLLMWSDESPGYPTIGAPEGTRLLGKKQCRNAGGVLSHMILFHLAYPTDSQRYFAAASWQLSVSQWLKALFHGSSRALREEAFAVMRSVSFSS
jgi:hypothetical protein